VIVEKQCNSVTSNIIQFMTFNIFMYWFCFCRSKRWPEETWKFVFAWSRLSFCFYLFISLNLSSFLFPPKQRYFRCNVNASCNEDRKRICWKNSGRCGYCRQKLMQSFTAEKCRVLQQKNHNAKMVLNAADVPLWNQFMD